MPKAVLFKLENDAKRHLKAPPFGLLYLASALERGGFDVRLRHATVRSAADIEALADEAANDDPLFVGFSTLTGPSLVPTLAVSQAVKRRTAAPVVWGGLHPTMLPEQVLTEGCVDAAVLGEGEETVVELAAAYSKGRGRSPDLSSILGLAYKENGRVRINPPRPFIRDLDAYHPAWSYLNIEDYLYEGRYFHTEGGSRLSGGRIAAVLTSRGCPWRCAYCYNTGINRRTFRAHSASRVISEVRELRDRHGVLAVNIQDDHFFGDPRRAREIVRGMGLAWASSARADEIVRWGDDVLAELKANGCAEFQIGAESGSPSILELMRKDITVEDILRAAELCGRHGIRILFSFMAGLPGETEADRRLTYDLMDRLEGLGDHIVVNGPAVYFPWPGTPMYDIALKHGFKPPARTKDWDFLLWGTHQPNPIFVPRHVRMVEHYRRLAFRKVTAKLKVPLFASALARLARFRWRHRAFRFPLDYHLPRFLLGVLRALGPRGAAAVYDD